MRAAVLVVLAACGRLNFEPIERIDDAASDAPPAALPVVQSMMTAMFSSSESVGFGVSQTQPGSLLVVGTISFNVPGTAAPVKTIFTDAGDTFASVGQLAPWNGGEGATEVWFAANSKGGASLVTIESTGLTTREIWYLEVSGLDAVAPLQTAVSVIDHPAAANPGAPVVSPERTPALVVSVMQITGFLTTIAAGNPFTALPVINGDDTAYLIATEPGAYGAAWDGSGTDNYSAVTAVFLPPP